MDEANDALVFADATGAIRHFSAGAERLFGYDARTAIGQSLDLIVPPDFRAQHWAAFWRAMKTGECGLDRAAAHLPVLCADGRVRVFPGRFTFVSDLHGRGVGAVAVYGEGNGGAAPFSPVENA
jgi:PAS domain S-box-containing protein